MADNYLEKQYEDYCRKKEASRRASNLRWQKQLRAHAERKRAAQETAPDTSRPSVDAMRTPETGTSGRGLHQSGE